MNPLRDRFWLLAALLFGLLVLPFLVHGTGVYVLGEYAGGGAAAFFGSYLRDLVTLRDAERRERVRQPVRLLLQVPERVRGGGAVLVFPVEREARPVGRPAPGTRPRKSVRNSAPRWPCRAAAP